MGLVLGIIALVGGLILFVSLLTNVSTKTNTLGRFYLMFFALLMVGAGMFLIVSGIMAISLSNLQAQQKQLEIESIREYEAASVKEFEVEKKISADKAWWLKLSSEDLQKECQALALKIGKDWQSLIDLLSGKNATVIFTPQPILP